MFTVDIVQGLVIGFREGLEAFLVIAIMLEYLNKTNKQQDKKYVYQGLSLGIVASIVFGLLILGLSKLIGESSGNLGKLWESITSFVALGLITTFIYWMLNNRNNIVSDIKEKMSENFSKISIILLATVMVAREGAEIVLFVFASVNPNSYILGTAIGLILAILTVFLIYKSLIKVNLKIIFNITLFYLILQAGFMLGYAVHELLSYLKATDIVNSGSIVYTKMFDLSGTFLDHKEKLVGILLYATIGWYSKPEVIQFIIQYVYTGIFVYMFFKTRNK